MWVYNREAVTALPKVLAPVEFLSKKNDIHHILDFQQYQML